MSNCIKKIEEIQLKEVAIEIDNILNNNYYKTNFLTAEKWLDVKYEDLVSKIVNYFQKLK